MNRRFLLIAAVTAGLACSRASGQLPTTVAVAHDPQLQHHEIHIEQLPRPYATSSSGNPPYVEGQPRNAALHVPPGFRVSLFADKLGNPRGLLLAPNGDVILSEPGEGKITILRDANHDGIAEQRFTFASGLNDPYGLAFHDRWLYVGKEDAVVRFPYKAGQTAANGGPEQIASLPPGGHSTRGVVFNRAGTKMYVSIGSASNVDSGEPPERAAIVEMNPDGSGKRIFASGMRNPVGMAWEPVTGALWTAVNERDGLGDELVPDYATSVQAGAFYGWPYAYLGQHEDPRRAGERPDLVRKTIPPSVLIQSHSAPLGIAFYEGTMFPPEYRGRAFVAMHGSWNRSRRTGYKIISIPFRNGQPTGGYDDFVAGWMTDETSRTVWGRPVGLLVLGDGSLLISDDGAGKIWRVTFGK
ncbi:MAG TPA: sorbosone dehydrogenase family protein [Thermoanaerobaculia bacterium]|nr:sorbosone dehydrogenase family protein [Thermoanaerobaculia bacterium]